MENFFSFFFLKKRIKNEKVTLESLAENSEGEEKEKKNSKTKKSANISGFLMQLKKVFFFIFLFIDFFFKAANHLYLGRTLYTDQKIKIFANIFSATSGSDVKKKIKKISKQKKNFQWYLENSKKISEYLRTLTDWEIEEEIVSVLGEESDEKYQKNKIKKKSWSEIPSRLAREKMLKSSTKFLELEKILKKELSSPLQKKILIFSQMKK